MAVALAKPVHERHCPWGVHPGSQRRQQHQPPVPDLVAEPLYDEGAIGGEVAGGGQLFLEVGGQVAGGEPIQAVALLQQRLDRGGIQTSHLPKEPSQLAAGFDGAPQRVSVPEGHGGSGLAGSRDHLDAVMGDVADAPGAGTEDEHVSRP